MNRAQPMYVGAFAVSRRDGDPMTNDDCLDAAMDLLDEGGAPQGTQDAVFGILVRDGLVDIDDDTEIRSVPSSVSMGEYVLASWALMAVLALAWWAACSAAGAYERCLDLGHSVQECAEVLR